MSLQVIGAGFGRTGTKSLKQALEILLGGRCFHMVELIENRPERLIDWLKKSRGEAVDFRAMFEGYNATVDWPSAAYYAELAELYPEAKVVLTVRDPERWYESVRETIYGFSKKGQRPPMSWLHESHPTRWPMSEMVERTVWGESGHFGGRFEDKAYAISVYEKHTEEVKATISADRLLVYELKQGWEPLCAHLGVPVPDVPLPNVNGRDEMLTMLKRLEVVSWVVSPITAPLSVVMRALR